MEFWPTFWSVFLVFGLSVFAVVAVLVTVGGYRDLRRMFAKLEEERQRGE